MNFKSVLKFPWRDFLARLPLPMLAFSASYGVYSFALLYVPEWVAIAQAAAFELTYIGLAVTRSLNDHQRKRATAISIGAVVVSVLYNSLSGLFHRQPNLLHGLDWYLEAGLAVLHGAPLAWVAYLVADLLLHTGEKSAQIEAIKGGNSATGVLAGTQIPTVTNPSPVAAAPTPKRKVAAEQRPQVEQPPADEAEKATVVEPVSISDYLPELVDWKATAWELSQSGMSGRQIAEQVGKTATAVNGFLKVEREKRAS